MEQWNDGRMEQRDDGIVEGWSDGKTGDILFFWILPFSNIPVFQYSILPVSQYSTIPTFQCSMFLVAALPRCTICLFAGELSAGESPLPEYFLGRESTHDDA
jgi:hypothetical protein